MILNIYSVSELAFIYYKKTDLDFLIALEMSYLLKKGNLKIDGNSLVIVNRENLNYIQNYLLDSLKFIDLSNFKKEFRTKLK